MKRVIGLVMTDRQAVALCGFLEFLVVVVPAVGYILDPIQSKDAEDCMRISTSMLE